MTHEERIAPAPAGHTIEDLESGATLAPCNECGLLTDTGDELCDHCYREQMESEEWEAMHPETRCPPRE